MAKRIPQLNIPLLKDLYSPDFDPLKLPINKANLLEVPEEQLAKIEEKVKEVEAKLFSGEVPMPLSREEAEEVERQVDALRSAIAESRRRISSVRSRIDKQAVPEGQPEINFSVDLEKKAHLRRAIKKVFGIKPAALTYSMYKAALEAKRAIEESEAKEYVSGDWSE